VAQEAHAPLDEEAPSHARARQIDASASTLDHALLAGCSGVREGASYAAPFDVWVRWVDVALQSAPLRCCTSVHRRARNR
jgi:hypothetical protein